MKELEMRYEIARWIARRFIGTLTREEQQQLEKWQNASEENAREYEEIRMRLGKDLRVEDKLDVAEEWYHLESKLPGRKRIHRLWYYTAAVCAGICLMFSIWMVRTESINALQQTMSNTKSFKAVLILDDGEKINLEESSEKMIAEITGTKITIDGHIVRYDTDSLSMEQSTGLNTVVVPRGGEYELLLADGTKVWLNSESQLTYPVQFTGNTREVMMKGEVCFDVAKNEKQPFIVKTADVEVTVLGTLFNMEAYPEDQRITTTLVRGKVEVNTGMKKQILIPDQQVVVEADGRIQMKKVNGEGYVSWTNGVFHFTEASLDEIMTRLARWYDVEFFFSSPALKNAHFTLDIQRYEHVSTILSKIEKTGRVRFKVNGKTVVIQE